MKLSRCYKELKSSASHPLYWGTELNFFFLFFYSYVYGFHDVFFNLTVFMTFLILV